MASQPGPNFLVPKTTLIVYRSGYSRKYETICTRVTPMAEILATAPAWFRSSYPGERRR